MTGTRTEYLRYLGTVRKLAREAAVQQRAALLWEHPDPAALPALAEERSRVWEHMATDPEFLQVRYGVCSQPLSLELVPPDSAPIDQVDPAAASALHRLLAVHRVQPNLPAAVDLRAFDRIEVCGPEEDARSLARAMICSAASFQSPEHLAIAVLASEESLAEWDWVKWLPHALSGVTPTRSARAGWCRPAWPSSPPCFRPTWPSARASAPTSGRPTRTCCSWSTVPSSPGNHVIPPDGLHGMTVLDLPTRWDELQDSSRLRLLFEDGAVLEDGRPVISALRLREPAGARGSRPERPADGRGGRAAARAAARGDRGRRGRADQQRRDRRSVGLHGPAGPRRRPAVRRDRGLAHPPGARPAAGADRARRRRDDRCTSTSRSPPSRAWVPHGLVIGATGSGKSEFLRTLVLGLALTHSPEQLNMVLVDFKGGATFAGMSAMPHVSAVITNLAERAHPGRPHAGRPVR